MRTNEMEYQLSRTFQTLYPVLMKVQGNKRTFSVEGWEPRGRWESTAEERRETLLVYAEVQRLLPKALEVAYDIVLSVPAVAAQVMAGRISNAKWESLDQARQQMETILRQVLDSDDNGLNHDRNDRGASVDIEVALDDSALRKEVSLSWSSVTPPRQGHALRLTTHYEFLAVMSMARIAPYIQAIARFANNIHTLSKGGTP